MSSEFWRMPCVSAFLLALSLPTLVLGPVDLSAFSWLAAHFVGDAAFRFAIMGLHGIKFQVGDSGVVLVRAIHHTLPSVQTGRNIAEKSGIISEFWKFFDVFSCDGRTPHSLRGVTHKCPLTPAKGGRRPGEGRFDNIGLQIPDPHPACGHLLPAGEGLLAEEAVQNMESASAEKFAHE